MRADLHIHSVYSDGQHTIEEIAALAKRKGVELISVTDHDNMTDDDKKRKIVEEAGLLYVSGWEISAYLGYKVHVTGYRCDFRVPAYRDFLEARMEGAYARTKEILSKVKDHLGISVSLGDVEAERKKPDSPLHTMFIARAVHKKGVCRDEFEVYEKYLARGKPCTSGLGRPTPMEAIEVIHALGGIASLAHPGRIEDTPAGVAALAKRLKMHGLDGIECVYSSHTEEETKRFCALAEELGCLVTGGSDMHREGEGRRLGEPYFEPSEELLRALRIH